MKEDITKEIELREVTVELVGNSLKFKGPKGEAERIFLNPKVNVAIEGNKIILKSLKATKREKKIVGSFESHIKNLIEGVLNLHTYKLKICSGHFPMNVAIVGSEIVIKNFLGESVPRKVKIVTGADVKINGTEIVVTSTNKEIAGQTAANIESLCRITNRDKRIFQDGCYIIHKSGKDI
jgi:large subunit ribosomal protein L6